MFAQGLPYYHSAVIHRKFVLFLQHLVDDYIAYSQKRLAYMPILFEFLKVFFSVVYGNGKSYVLRSKDNGRAYSYGLAFHVEKRPPGVSRVYGGIRLYETPQSFDTAFHPGLGLNESAKPRNYAGGYCIFEFSQSIPHSYDIFSQIEAQGIAEFYVGELLICFYF